MQRLKSPVAQVQKEAREGTPVGRVRSRSTGSVSPGDARGSGLVGGPQPLRAWREMTSPEMRAEAGRTAALYFRESYD